MKYDKILTKETLIKELRSLFVVDIARKYGTSTHTVYKYIKKYHLIYDTKLEQFKTKYIGKRYGKLIIVDYAKNDSFNKRMVKCKCDCGESTILNISSLTRGLTKSCGCHKTSICQKKSYQGISYQFYRRLKRQAIQRGLEFTITQKDIWDCYIQQNMRCIYSGLNIEFVTDFNDYTKQTASIDRIDCRRGYTPDNIQIVHRRINVMRGNMNNDEFYYYIYHIFNHIKPIGTLPNKFTNFVSNGRRTNIEVKEVV